MSGIVGLLHLDGAPTDRCLLERMTGWLGFRGPEAGQTWLDGPVGLGHTLLPTTDEAEHERQPFTLDGRRWIVADARVDGRRDLIDAIAARAPAPALDAPDVELLLRAYEVWGRQCVDHLLGDFTFAVWDAPRRRLFCARDHLGVKPFYYARLGETLVFSNTLDCLRQHPAVSATLHDPAIADFLLFGVNQNPGTTTFRDIQRLPPAHTVTWSAGVPVSRRYWSLPVDEPIHLRRADDYVERFQALLRVAVDDRLRTGRVGVLMSGGVDSPALAAVARERQRARSVDAAVVAFTSVYERPAPDQEGYYARLVAEHLGIPIRFDVRDDEPSIARWDRVTVHTPEPVANPPAFAASLAFWRRASAEARVFLYGEGPDQALRYEWRAYLAYLLAGWRVGACVRAVTGELRMHPRVPLLGALRALAWRRASQRLWEEAYPSWLNEDFAARCGCRERWEAWRRGPARSHPVRPAGHAGFATAAWLSLFEDCDLNGALAGTEVRHPYLDLRLLRYLLALPAMPWCRNKLIIRRSLRGALPAEVLARPKTPSAADPDFARVLASGYPTLVPSDEVRRYVRPERIPAVPRRSVDLRAQLRPFGLGYWLRHLRGRP